MAATDQFYRNQKTLNVVFSVSCVLTLLVTIWMLWDDYNKPYKTVQREFRDVETLVNERAMLARLPDAEEVEAKLKVVDTKRAALKQAEANTAEDRRQLQADKDKATAEYQRIKADLDSVASYRDIEAEKLGHAKGAEKEAVKKKVDAYENQLKALSASLAGAQDRLTKLDQDYQEKVGNKVDSAQRELTLAQEDLKRLTDNFSRMAKVTAEKRWKMGDTFRNLPIIDGFAPPTRIHQITLNDLPIDYGGFKDVTRYDRCMTCHLGIERANYDRTTLAELARPADKERLRKSYAILKKIKDRGEMLGFDIEDVNPDKLEEVKPIQLSNGQITMYAAHPRLDLYVDSNSPHSAEKFGCTACHGGQGSATDFNLASHTPNDAAQSKRWASSHSSESPDSYHWHANHYWDFPMMPKRFAESTCLKCHHQVTDTVRNGNREEAPKLMDGYQLVRENGCFGCHEIAGQKGGRPVGPDMRLEPTPSLDWLSPAERTKAMADAQNQPGGFRKVGPGLRRLQEKTTDDWVARWIKSPRGFREDTKMPHFYGQPNNSGGVLPPEQQAFPDVEMYAITKYLMTESKLYLEGEDSTRKVVAEQVEKLEKILGTKGLTIRERKDLAVWAKRYGDLILLASPTDRKEINDLIARQQVNYDQLIDIYTTSSPADTSKNPKAEHPRKAEIDVLVADMGKVSAQLATFKPVAVSKQIIKANGEVLSGEFPAPTKPTDLLKGRKLFTEKGCMACHSHDGTREDYKSEQGQLPGITSEANFGPNLSRVAVKIPKNEQGRRWLVQWLLNPNVHSPRTKMPVTHLSTEDAASIADWIMSQEISDWDIDPVLQAGPGLDSWSKVKVEKPDLATLQALAVVYLKGTAIGKQDADKVAKAGLNYYAPNRKENESDADYQKRREQAKRDRVTSPDADEWLLDGDATEEKLLRYVGKKAINRQGCFGCHDIPGFETAKPIGTPLNDWGKKDGERLAFEDAGNYIKTKYHVVEVRDDANDPSRPDKNWKIEDGKRPYEKLFAETIHTHNREAFLSLKLADPRSYDYERLRSWEDRLRMPQFQFGRSVRRQKDEMLREKPLNPVGSKDEEDIFKKATAAEQSQYAQEWAEYKKNPKAWKEKDAALRNTRWRTRLTFEEARARDSVMTFVLGLVAEPIPMKYVSQPKKERLDEVKGLHVLEKYNCSACHHIRPGSVDFTLGRRIDERQTMVGKLNDKADPKIYEPDFYYPSSNGWNAGPTPMGKITATGALMGPVIGEDGSKQIGVLLSEALRYHTEEGEGRTVRAGEQIQIPVGLATRQTSPYGGTWTNAMVPWLDELKKRNPAKLFGEDVPEGYKQLPERYGALPPPLLREGERVQSQWLYQFLLDPQMIRPATVLRMPRFNMSDEESRALVNYFTAVSRLNNPGVGVTESYVRIPQKDASYWTDKTNQYVKRYDKKTFQERVDSMAPIWDAYLQDELKEKQKSLDRIEKDLKDPMLTAEAKKALETQRDAMKTDLDKMKKQIADKNYKELNEKWQSQQVYATDAYKLLLDRNLCLKCHNVGNVEIVGSSAPNLALAAERLRPEWVEQWIANPPRMMSYTPAMPQNFPANQDDALRAGLMKTFHGSDSAALQEKDPAKKKELIRYGQRERVEGVRDVLFDLQRISNLPATRYAEK